jgi:lipopolysaccharide transport system ATP-binding protein
VSAAITVDGVSKRFRMFRDRSTSLKSVLTRGRKRLPPEDFWALTDVSFEVPRGSTFGLIGRNGSGKSTLLKCISRILQPDAGTITVEGRVASLLEVGSGFHPELTGRENIYLNGAILGMSKKEIASRYDQIVHFSGIKGFIDQPVKNYSSGMYVRLGFSVAIHVDPDVLIVDEVLAVGDAAFQTKSRQKFAEFQSADRTIVLVSHSMSAVKEFCDQAVWLDGGKIKAVGPAAEVADAYLAHVEEFGDDD